jgi:DNA-binding transcriptional LysR family regulator
MRVGLLETGRFITVFPASALRFLTRGAALKVLPVELPMARRPNGIVTLKNRALSPVSQLVINSARELAKPLAKRK